MDCEFIEDGHTIDLISIGIVAEDGREFYAISTEFDESKASDWVKTNVLPHLPPRPLYPQDDSPWQPRSRIRLDVLRFIKPELGDAGGFIDDDHIYQRLASAEIQDEPEFWAYYADYDWVVFCQLFGTMMDLSKGFPMYCRDIKQWCDQLGNPELPQQDSDEHNALADARWNKQSWELLRLLSKHGRPNWTL